MERTVGVTLPAGGSRTAIRVSVIVPVFNEEESVAILHEKLRRALQPAFQAGYEIVFVDDGSTDRTPQILENLPRSNSAEVVRTVRIGSRAGQHKAIERGFQEARGDIIVTIDADLQNDPADIPGLISKLNEGYDLVCGWRYRRDDGWAKTFKSRLGNFIQRKITKVQLHDMSCTLRAYRRNVIEGVTLNRVHDIGLIPLMISSRTARIAEVKVQHSRRRQGQSKYGFWSTFFGACFCFMSIAVKGNRIEE